MEPDLVLDPPRQFLPMVDQPFILLQDNGSGHFKNDMTASEALWRRLLKDFLFRLRKLGLHLLGTPQQFRSFTSAFQFRRENDESRKSS